MQDKREWMRNHKVEGFVVSRFIGTHDQPDQEFIALQTVDGVIVIPATTAIPVDATYILNQISLDLERVIRGMRDGGLTFEEMEHVWKQALTHVQQVEHRYSF